jgi:hypothetical protein
MCIVDKPNGNSVRLLCLSSSFIDLQKVSKGFHSIFNPFIMQTIFLIWLIVCNLLTNICTVIFNVVEFPCMREISTFHPHTFRETGFT